MSDEEIVAAYRESGSIWKAAKRLGLCGQSVHERLHRLGYQMAHQAWSRVELEDARRLALQGEPLAQIAARLGRTYHAVALKLSRTGVKSRHATWRWKPKRVRPPSRSRVRRFAALLDEEGWSVRRLARREGLAITPLVDAIQSSEPAVWQRYVANHSRLQERTCPGCGVSFVPLTKKQRFCTVRCREAHRRNLAYFGGRRFEAIGLREGICQLCGKASGKWLSAHHVLGRENDPDNAALIALCRGCHDLVTNLGARPWVVRPAVVAQLIALSLARRGRPGALVAVGVAVPTPNGIRDYFGQSGDAGGDVRTAAVEHDRKRPSEIDPVTRRRPDSRLLEIHLRGPDSVGRPKRVHFGRDGSR